MKTISYRDDNFSSILRQLYSRPSYPPEFEAQAAAIITEVRERGDAALIDFARKFDASELTEDNIQVSTAELEAAGNSLDRTDKQAIGKALENVQTFARQRLPKDWNFSPREGVSLGERFVPMDKVGVYIPGGTAPLVSTVIHTAGIAAAAGVKEICAVTPPGGEKGIHPATLYAMKIAGVSKVYRLGGVYGIAALAYGTQSVEKVEKIVGPGNAYVTAAKKLVYGQVAIDMVAGPSEIMIIADASDAAAPEFIAADMLSQAEHGSGLEQAVLVTTDPNLPAKVETAIIRQKAALSRSATIDKVLEQGVFFIIAQSLEQASEIASSYAPEHLELMCENPRQLSQKIKSAGAIFLGKWTPEPIGDFCAGPSHVLPTASSAKFFGGLSVEGFFRRMSMVEYDCEALLKEAPVAASFAELEGLDAHGNSVLIRK